MFAIGFSQGGFEKGPSQLQRGKFSPCAKWNLQNIGCDVPVYSFRVHARVSSGARNQIIIYFTTIQASSARKPPFPSPLSRGINYPLQTSQAGTESRNPARPETRSPTNPFKIQQPQNITSRPASRKPSSPAATPLLSPASRLLNDPSD